MAAHLPGTITVACLPQDEINRKMRGQDIGGLYESGKMMVCLKGGVTHAIAGADISQGNNERHVPTGHPILSCKISIDLCCEVFLTALPSCRR